MNTVAVKLEMLAAAENAATTFFRERLGGVDAYACGFAWVTVKPQHKGNTKLGREERKVFTALGLRKDYSGKYYEIYNPGNYHGQNIDTKEAGAHAAAEVLRRHGFNAFAESRLD